MEVLSNFYRDAFIRQLKIKNHRHKSTQGVLLDAILDDSQDYRDRHLACCLFAGYCRGLKSIMRLVNKFDRNIGTGTNYDESYYLASSVLYAVGSMQTKESQLALIKLVEGARSPTVQDMALFSMGFGGAMTDIAYLKQAVTKDASSGKIIAAIFALEGLGYPTSNPKQSLREFSWLLSHPDREVLDTTVSFFSTYKLHREAYEAGKKRLESM